MWMPYWRLRVRQLYFTSAETIRVRSRKYAASHYSLRSDFAGLVSAVL